MLLHTASGTCPVCGSQGCTGIPATYNSIAYPFLTGGHDAMAEQLYVVTPTRIIDEDTERVAYGAGDKVPLEDAVRLGLVSAADAERVAKGAGDDWQAENTGRAKKMAAPAPKRSRGAVKPATGRAKRRGENRAHGPSEDR